MSNISSDLKLPGHDVSWITHGQHPPVHHMDPSGGYTEQVPVRESKEMNAGFKEHQDTGDDEDMETEEDDNSSSSEEDDEDVDDNDDEKENDSKDNVEGEYKHENEADEETDGTDTDVVEDDSQDRKFSHTDTVHLATGATETTQIDQKTYQTSEKEILDVTQLKRDCQQEIENVAKSDSQSQAVQQPMVEYQQRELQRSTLTYSSEQIPKSNQTLKMRLKLSRVPIEGIQVKQELEEVQPRDTAPEVSHRLGKRKRGRPAVPIKQEAKKFLQISLGKQADRWQEVKTFAGGHKFHSQVAKLLLDCFDAILDGSLHWSPDTTNANLGLKTRMHKMFVDQNLSLPNDSWQLDTKGRRKSVLTSPASSNKTSYYKEDSQEDIEDEEDADFGEEEFVDNSTDEDYQPEMTITRQSKRTQPKRRKQSTPRRVVSTKQDPADNNNKKVKPLKVILSKEIISEATVKIEEDDIELEEPQRSKKRSSRRSSDAQPKYPPPPLIPPEFMSYPKIFKCRRCPAKSENTYLTLELLKEHYETHKCDNVLPKKKYAPHLPPLSPDGEETEEEAMQRMAKVLISCPHCKKLFFPGRLVQHLKTAHVRVLCEECGGMFSRVAMCEHKKAHKFKAEGKKPYKCDKCDKEFLWQVSLRQHRELHSKERPFICSACGKSFKTLTKMKRHEIIHEAVKPFVCPHCRRSFTQRTNLKTHIRTHTGEKPYQCEYCAKHFTHKVSMKTHMKKEHGVDMWRDGPSHRVQEFDDVRCQMKRRKNPQTASIQRYPKGFYSDNASSQKDVFHDEMTALGVQQHQEHVTAQNNIPVQSDDSLRKVSGKDDDDELEDHRHYREEAREFHNEQRGLMEDNDKRLMEVQRGLSQDEHGVMEDGRVHNEEHTPSQMINESPHDIVGIPLSDRQQSPHDIVGIPISERQQQQQGKPGDDSSSHTMEQHHGNGHQMQNCISPTNQARCDTVLTEESQTTHHNMQQRASHDTSMHYTPQYLPVSTDISHVPQHMPPDSNHSTGVSRYPGGHDSTVRYPPMPAMHSDALRQGSLSHHDLQQSSAGVHQTVTHPRYPGWPPPQAAGPGPQGYIPGEMGPAILSEIMKMSK